MKSNKYRIIDTRIIYFKQSLKLHNFTKKEISRKFQVISIISFYSSPIKSFGNISSNILTEILA